MVSTDDEKDLIDYIVKEERVTFTTKVIIINVKYLKGIDFHIDGNHNIVLDKGHEDKANEIISFIYSV
jgi:hypothetical protein